jgi:glucosyl-3-phosphoglycerate synthase
MADFYQNGIITTLHNLSNRPLEDVERELVAYSRVRPMGLLLPSCFPSWRARRCRASSTT